MGAWVGAVILELISISFAKRYMKWLPLLQLLILLKLALNVEAWGFDLEILRLGGGVGATISGCGHSCFSLSHSSQCLRQILETPREGIVAAMGHV